MNIEIVAITDDNFTLITNTVGVNENIIKQIEELETLQIPLETEVIEVPTQVVSNTGPRPVPLENHKSTGMGWFDGTSWGTAENKRGV